MAGASASSTHFDAIVVGLGIMGAAAAAQLAGRGARVLGLEQFDIPHSRGSSHGHTRLIRQAYFEHPDYVPLLRRAYALWRALEHASGQKLLEQTGGLYIGRPGGELVAGSLRSAREHGLPHELLDHAALSRRYPQFAPDGDMIGVFEPGAGYLYAEQALCAFAQQALAKGALLFARQPVTQWHSDGRRATVQTAAGTFTADRLLLAAGAWAARLLGELQLPLRVSRQVVGWLWPRNPEQFAAERFPIWAFQSDTGRVHYGTPLLAGGQSGLGLKVGSHEAGATADPDAVCREKLAGDEETFRPFVARHLPDANGPLLALTTCLYTNTPDAHFVIDFHPQLHNVIFAAGFSGHGFKFAPVIGELLADLALDGRSALPAGFLSLERLRAQA